MKKKVFCKWVMLCMLLCCSCVAAGCSNEENKSREELVKEISVEDLQSGIYNTDLLMLEDWDTMVSNGTVCVEDGEILSSFSCQYEDYILVIDDSVQEIGDDVFSSNNHLKEVVIPDSVTEIGESAFYSCIMLETIYGGNRVSEIGGFAFRCCLSLKEISIPEQVSVIKFGTFAGCENLKKIIIPDSVKTIEEEAFWYCEKMESVSMSDSVTSIGEEAFYGCATLVDLKLFHNLESIGEEAFWLVNNIGYTGEITGEDNWGAKTLNGYVDGYAVYEDDTKKTLTGVSTMITEFDIPESVTKIEAYAFYECNKMKSLKISENVKSIGENAFLYVNNIEYSGKLTSNDNWGAKTLNGYVDGDVVYESKAKKKLTGACALIKGTFDIPDSVTEIGEFAFCGCEELEGIIIPDSVNRIKKWAFAECKQIKNVIVPNSVKHIEEDVFSDCRNLITVTLPDKLKRIETELFFDCQNLENVVIPQGVNEIGECAFFQCYNIKNLIVPDTVTTIEYYAFCDVPDSELTYNGDAVDNYEDSNGRWGAVFYSEGE